MWEDNHSQKRVKEGKFPEATVRKPGLPHCALPCPHTVQTGRLALDQEGHSMGWESGDLRSYLGSAARTLWGPGKSLPNVGPQFPPESQLGLDWQSVCLSDTVVAGRDSSFRLVSQCLPHSMPLLANRHGSLRAHEASEKAGSIHK